MANTEKKEFDVRTVERMVARGQVPHDDVQKILKALPDDAANGVYRSWADVMAPEKR